MTDRKKEPAVPEPSYLPPNPSVGELNTEIDRARHEAMRTMNALAKKFDRPAVRTSIAVARPLATPARYARRVPVVAWIAIALMLLRWMRHRRRGS